MGKGRLKDENYGIAQVSDKNSKMFMEFARRMKEKIGSQAPEILLLENILDDKGFVKVVSFPGSKEVVNEDEPIWESHSLLSHTSDTSISFGWNGPAMCYGVRLKEHTGNTELSMFGHNALVMFFISDGKPSYGIDIVGSPPLPFDRDRESAMCESVSITIVARGAENGTVITPDNSAFGINAILLMAQFQHFGGESERERLKNYMEQNQQGTMLWDMYTYAVSHADEILSLMYILNKEKYDFVTYPGVLKKKMLSVVVPKMNLYGGSFRNRSVTRSYEIGDIETVDGKLRVHLMGDTENGWTHRSGEMPRHDMMPCEIIIAEDSVTVLYSRWESHEKHTLREIIGGAWNYRPVTTNQRVIMEESIRGIDSMIETWLKAAPKYMSCLEENKEDMQLFMNVATRLAEMPREALTMQLLLASV